MLTTQLRELETEGRIRRKILREWSMQSSPPPWHSNPLSTRLYVVAQSRAPSAGEHGSRPRQPQGPESVMISTRAKIKILAAQLRMTRLKHKMIVEVRRI